MAPVGLPLSAGASKQFLGVLGWEKDLKSCSLSPVLCEDQRGGIHQRGLAVSQELIWEHRFHEGGDWFRGAIGLGALKSSRWVKDMFMLEICSEREEHNRK